MAGVDLRIAESNEPWSVARGGSTSACGVEIWRKPANDGGPRRRRHHEEIVSADRSERSKD